MKDTKRPLAVIDNRTYEIVAVVFSEGAAYELVALLNEKHVGHCKRTDTYRFAWEELSDSVGDDPVTVNLRILRCIIPLIMSDKIVGVSLPPTSDAAYEEWCN